MFGEPRRTRHFDDFPDGGGYPKGFVEWALGEMHCDDPERVLHLCSGSMRTGLRIDVRASTSPHVVADCRSTPFPDETFDFILIDPPYAADYAANLYGTGEHYPKPGQVLAEAARILRPGGQIGFLHFLVPLVRRPLELVGVYGVTTGSGYAIRAWSHFRRSAQLEMAVA